MIKKQFEEEMISLGDGYIIIGSGTDEEKIPIGDVSVRVSDFQSQMPDEDRDIVCQAGKFRLEEWGKHRYHQFYNGDEPLEDESVVIMLMKLTRENEQLKSEITGLEELLKSYRKTIKHDAELLADATKRGYLPPLEELEGDME